MTWTSISESTLLKCPPQTHMYIHVDVVCIPATLVHSAVTYAIRKDHQYSALCWLSCCSWHSHVFVRHKTYLTHACIIRNHSYYKNVVHYTTLPTITSKYTQSYSSSLEHYSQYWITSRLSGNLLLQMRYCTTPFSLSLYYTLLSLSLCTIPFSLSLTLTLPSSLLPLTSPPFSLL